MRNLLLSSFLCLFTTVVYGQQQQMVSGTITAEGAPLPGASVTVKGTAIGAVTDSDGDFSLELERGSYTLVVSYIGFTIEELDITVPSAAHLSVDLEPDVTMLREIEVVSTGYQKLPEERSTGSFEHLNTDLVNRAVTPNLINRLEGVTPGLLFNRDVGGQENNITIRGTSTIFADARPLIVIDNFPYDGPLENINPNDVESITVLKDAAAASIWGARAGNGVIVITTKSGIEGKPRISFNSFLSVAEKPDLFYEPQMDIAEFIEVERDLFGKGVYNSSENSRNNPDLSPVVETLIKLRDGIITEQEANALIDNYKAVDTRSQVTELFYRPAVAQQYALSFSGGNANNKYVYSAGYDKQLAALKGYQNSRFTFNARNEWQLLNQKLQVSAGLYYSRTNSLIGTDAPPSSLAPYTPLVDNSGNPLPVNHDYSERFVNRAAADGLLDWKYFPVREIGLLDHNLTGNDVRLTASLGYKIIPGLNAEVFYQNWLNNTENRQHYPENSYFVRDLVNNYTTVETDGTLTKNIPEGGILNVNNSSAYSHTFRSQLSWSEDWKDKLQVSALAGFEIKDYQGSGNSIRYYGYDDDLGISTPVDYVNRYRRYYNSTMANIPGNENHSGFVDRFVSFYANASYTFDNRYIVSGSARKDASNLFGVDSNKKGVPLWSAGFAWVINEESFYNVGWLPYLRFRTSYGYNGNIVKNITAYPTAYYLPGAYNRTTGLTYAQITSPPNPQLQWERIKIINTGIDFESRNSIIAGSLEVYLKKGLDLVGDTPFPTSSGISSFRGNNANTSSVGIDVSLNSRNLRINDFEWSTNLFYTHLSEKVTKYEEESSVTEYLSYGHRALNILGSPYEGRPLYGIYSFPWGGLDPDTGDPLGYVDGELSNDYVAIRTTAEPEDLVFHGSGRPVHFGAVRNNFSYKNLSLSLNISYRAGYFYRRRSLDYEDIMTGKITHSDYNLRWQEPGDELHTDIPSIPASRNRHRDLFYTLSSPLIEPGDHIRLEDIRLAYSISDRGMFNRAEIYFYANNLGVLWKKSDYELDPDYASSRPLRTVAMGLKIDF